MKKSFFLLFAVLALSIYPGAHAADPLAGAWTLTERTGGEAVDWQFDILADGEGVIVGVGYPAARLDRNLSPDGEVDDSLAVFVLQPQEDGRLLGFFLEADGKGGQVEMGLEGTVATDGRELSLTGRNQLGETVLTADGRFRSSGRVGRFSPGEWSVREVVAEYKGGWDIYWDFKFSDPQEGLFGTGNKVQVNGREAQPGERKTVSRISLTRPARDGRVTGKGVETNHLGDEIVAEYQGWIAPSGNWFLLQSFEKDQVAALLYGIKLD